jgi:uncharacterized membrane protein YbhN (UPF0104 family)
MEPVTARNKAQSRVIRIAGTFIGLLLLGWLLMRQDWHLVGQYLSRLPVWILAAALLLDLAGQFLNALRWYILLRSQQVAIRFSESLKISFAGAFASNFLPSTIGGDVIRLVNINRYTSKEGLSLASIILDRLVNVLAFVTVLPFSFTFIPLPVSEVRNDLFFSFPLFIKNIRLWILQSGRQFLDAYKLWAEKPADLLRAFVTSWFSIVVIFISAWLVGIGLGIHVSLFQVAGITAIIYFITMLPISINGYGLREVGMTFLYLKLGANAEQATMLVLITRFLMMLVTVPGVFWIGSLSARKAE